MQTRIETERLVLEKCATHHVGDSLVAWLNDSVIVKYSDQRHHTHSVDSCLSYLGSFDGSDHHYWAITHKGTFIGTITAYVDNPNQVADVGIMIGAREIWGIGLGAEAFRGVVDWLFRVRGMRKVTAGTMALNESMLKVMEKVGMRVEYRKERYYLLDGAEVDMVCAGVFRANWSPAVPGEL
jgi:RimJ/RimL family protein N-acetyltransferase